MTIQLSILLREEDGCWVARCPELGTLAADPDLETAWEDIVRVCRAHLTCGLVEGLTLEDLVKPAPDDWLEIMAHASKGGKIKMQLSPSHEQQFEVERLVACG